MYTAVPDSDNNAIKGKCLQIFCCILLAFFLVAAILSPSPLITSALNTPCRFDLVESIPENVTFPDGSPFHLGTYEGWSSLLNDTESSIHMAVFYWSLQSRHVQNGSNFPSAWKGEKIYEQIKTAGRNGSIKISIVQNYPNKMSPQEEGIYLREAGLAKVIDINFPELLGGVLHTKLWIIDDKSFYIGSANMDFRSLTQVKELGIVVKDCPILAGDVKKIYEVYSDVGSKNSVPDMWPIYYHTEYNSKNPMKVNLNGVNSSVYFSSSPPPLSPNGREDDLKTIVRTILSAKEFVDVAVMDYFPRSLYSRNITYWDDIDSALRRVALEKKVKVRVLASHWSHSRPDLPNWLKSLQDISTKFPSIVVETKLFVVPSYNEEQRKIPFARVNHNKYMVTDSVAYIGTSNWSKDYFTNTGGIGLVIHEDEDKEGSLRKQLQAVFNRDWNSQYAKPLDEFMNKTEIKEEL